MKGKRGWCNNKGNRPLHLIMVILTTKIYIQQPLKNSTLPWHHQTTWLILILATIVNFYFWAMPFYYILLHCLDNLITYRNYRI